MGVRVDGAAENNLRFGDGITAVVLGTLSLGSPPLRMRPACVRAGRGVKWAIPDSEVWVVQGRRGRQAGKHQTGTRSA